MKEQVDAKQVIVETTEVEHNWTFAKYLKGIVKFKWFVVGFTLFGTLAGYLGVRFIINRNSSKLTAAFDYDLAGEPIANSTSIRLIDGSVFNVYDITAKNYLQDVKDNNSEKYAKVDIEKIVKGNAIKVTKVSGAAEGSSAATEDYYTIVANVKAFSSTTLGQDFIFDLINLPKSISSAAIDNFKLKSSFTDDFASLTFENQLSQLDEQYTSISDAYEELNKHFNELFIADDEGDTLSDLNKKFVSNYLTANNQEFIKELTSIADVNRYVNYVTGHEDEKIGEIHRACQSYNKSIKSNNEKIDILQSSLTELLTAPYTIEISNEISKQIVELSNKIQKLKSDNKTYENSLINNGYVYDDDPLSPTYENWIYNPGDTNSVIYHLSNLDDEWVRGCKNYATVLNNYKSRLYSDSIIATEAYKYCYNHYQNKVNVRDSGYVQVEGSISNVIGAAAGFAIGFVVTTLITAAVVVYKKEPEPVKE